MMWLVSGIEPQANAGGLADDRGKCNAYALQERLTCLGSLAVRLLRQFTSRVAVLSGSVECPIRIQDLPWC